MDLGLVRTRWKPEILRLAERHGIQNVRIFGSIARGEGGQDSDLDLLVGVEPGRSYLDFIAFWKDVEDALGCKVDVVDDEGINPYSRDTVLNDAVPL